MTTLKDVLLATGTTTHYEAEGDDIPLEEAVVEITKDVTLRVFNFESAVLEFGSSQRIEFSFNDEIAAMFVNIRVACPIELLATIGRASI